MCRKQAFCRAFRGAIELSLAKATIWGQASKEWSRAVDRTVARLNIEHYRRLLATETDETRRRMLLRLLAEEEAKLKSGNAPEKKLRQN